MIQAKGCLSHLSLDERNSTRRQVFLSLDYRRKKKLLTVTTETPPFYSSSQDRCMYKIHILLKLLESPHGGMQREAAKFQNFRAELGKALSNLAHFEVSPAWSRVLDWRSAELPANLKLFHAFMKEALQELALQRDVHKVHHPNIFQTT